MCVCVWVRIYSVPGGEGERKLGVAKVLPLKRGVLHIKGSLIIIYFSRILAFFFNLYFRVGG